MVGSLIRQVLLLMFQELPMARWCGLIGFWITRAPSSPFWTKPLSTRLPESGVPRASAHYSEEDLPDSLVLAQAAAASIGTPAGLSMALPSLPTLTSSWV